MNTEIGERLSWARWGLLFLAACGEAVPVAPREAERSVHKQARPGNAEDTENDSYYFVRSSRNTCDKTPCPFLVRRANQGVTRCDDGVLREECRVDEISLDIAGMRNTARELFFLNVAEGEALLQGKLVRQTQASGKISLQASHAWVRHGTPAKDSLLFSFIERICPFAGDCWALYGRLNSSELDRIRRETGEVQETSHQEQRWAACLNEKLFYSGRLVDPQEGPDQPLWTLSTDAVYTSALTLGCDPDQVALEAARNKFPPGVDVAWVDGGSPELQEVPYDSSSYTIRATGCSYWMRYPEGEASVEVDQKTCTFTLREHSSGSIY